MSSKTKARPLDSTFLARKGEAAPLAMGQGMVSSVPSAAPAPTPPAPPPPEPPSPFELTTPESALPKPKKATAAKEPVVPHNFRVAKSFKRAFDRAAFDREMTGVDFLKYIFAEWQEQEKKRIKS